MDSSPAAGRIRSASAAAPPAWQSRDQRESGPWSNKDASRTAIVTGSGLVAAVFCWYRGSGAETLGEQLPWLVGSIASAGVIVCALVAWLVAGFRNFRLLEHATVLTLLPLLEQLPGSNAAVEEDGDTRVAVAPGARHYHRTSCRMVKGKPGVSLAESDSVPGLHPCGICQP